MTNTGLPPHIARPGTDLVGPIVYFRHQPVAVTSSPPRDTTDPRYGQCTAHRLACDCREAETAEQISELRAEMRDVLSNLHSAINGHPTRVFIDGHERVDLRCACVPCGLARRIGRVPLDNLRHIWTRTDNR